MSCHKPMQAYKGRDGTVKIGRTPSLRGINESMQLPCGKCMGCKKDYARMWSLRIGHEAQLWDSNYFVTFDYDNEHLPKSLSLEYDDFQRFLKRLRKQFSGQKRCYHSSEECVGCYPVRYYVAGEYGARYKRPHYHAILFNLVLPDVEQYVNGTQRSGILEKIWGNGRAVMGTVTPQSCAYVAGYVNKKVYGKEAAEHYEDVVNLSTGEVSRRKPEFNAMSTRPGLGAWWYAKYKADIFPHDMAIERGGKRYKVPRFYYERYKKEATPQQIEEIEYARYLKSREIPLEERSQERLDVKEEYARRMMKERDLE